MHLHNGETNFGLGTRDDRPNCGRPLLAGTVADLQRAAERKAATRTHGLRFLVWVEDLAKMEVRTTCWDNFFGLTVYQDKSKRGKPLCLQEDYFGRQGKTADRLVDYSALGRHLQGMLDEGVVFLHIAIVGE